MGKICSVKSCPSGRKLKSKGIDRSQHLSFFRPTTPAKLKKWNKALGTTMNTTDYICHLHFKEEDIKMYDTFNIKGEITILPTGKKTLRDEALPTIKHQFISVPVHKLQARVVNNAQNVHSSENRSENERDYQIQEHEQEKLLLDQKVPDNSIHVIEETEDDLDIPHLNHKESDITSQSAEKFLENLKSSLLPQGWMYFEKPKGLEFGLINPTTMQISNRLRVNKDLSITVILSTNEELNVNDNIRSFDSINDYLQSVEKGPICVGTHKADKWLTACGREDLRDKMNKPLSYRLCASHFDDKMYLNDLKNRLLPAAVPTIFPSSNLTALTDTQGVPEKPVSREENASQSSEDSYLVQTIETSEDSSVKLKKKRNRCSVQGCKDLVSSRHRFPKREPEIFEAWLKIVKPPGYESLSKDMICNKYSVCDIHFRECDRIPKLSRMRGLSAIAVPLVKIPGLDSEYAESVVREALEKRDRRCMVRCTPVSHDDDNTIAIEFTDNYMTNYHIIDTNTNEEFLLDETTGLSNVHLAPGKMVLHIQITENQFKNQPKIKELPKCGKCHQEAVGKSVIHCDRGCEKTFHISCVDISQQNFDLLKMIDGTTWFCMNCRKK